MDLGVGSGDVELDDNGKGTVGLLPDSEILKQWEGQVGRCSLTQVDPRSTPG